MKKHKILAIYKKELLDMFRDKRTIATAIILPILLYPLMMIGFSSIIMTQQSKLRKESSLIGFADHAADTVSHTLRDSLAALGDFDLMPDVENPRLLLDERVINAHLTIDLPDSLQTGDFPVYRLLILYDKTDDKGSIVFEKLERFIFRFERQLIRDRLARLQVSPNVMEAVSLEEENIASSKKTVGSMIGRFLPYFLIILTISSGAVIAADIVAGEKERKTLETLLISGASRTDIVMGKYLTVITFSFISVLLNIFSMYLSIRHMVGQAGVDISEAAFPFSSFLLLFFAMVPLVTFLAGVLLSISTYSRNMREANTFLSPIMIVSMLLSFASMVPGLELNTGLALIPILNITLLFKQVMLEDFNLTHYLVTIISTLILDVLVIWMTVSLFQREGVLFRVEEDSQDKQKDKDKGSRKGKLQIFQPLWGLAVFSIVMLLLFYLGTTWQRKNLVWGLIQTQVILIYLPVYIVMRIGKTRFKEKLGLRLPSGKNFVIILLLAVPVLILTFAISHLTQFFYPMPEGYAEQFASKMEGIIYANPFLIFFVIALLPGICEEFFTRGYLLHAFRSQGNWTAIIAAGILFGIMHMDPFRFFPQAAIGVLFGFLYLRSGSFLIPVLGHFLHNGLIAAIPLFSAATGWDPEALLLSYPWLLYPLALLAGYFLLRWWNRINPEFQLHERPDRASLKEERSESCAES